MTSLTTSRTWSSFPSSGDTAAKLLGPFPFRPFLETVWHHRSASEAELVTASDGPNVVALSVADTHISFVGQENLTDYHSPIGAAFEQLLSDALSGHSGHSYRFDSMPQEVADIVSRSLEALGAPSTQVEHDAAAVMELPSSSDEWLSGLAKKERHEVRRKRRRLEETLGTPTIERMGVEAVGRFCAMHRTSAGDKGAFMTFGFETDDGYFYYNSAYDIDASGSSPGIVLVASMIEAQIERGAKVFDFLKGDQRYKFHMGALSRPLYMIEGRLP
jgi:CelD/BcsL family acetyltransferase involved in cellulose biosynthesis